MRKHGLPPSALCAAVREIISGLFDADLGGGLFKKRVARPGQGKGAGYRTLVATSKGSEWFFVYGFAKNERSNIDADELAALKKLSSHMLSLSALAVAAATDAGELFEVKCNAQGEIVNSPGTP